MQEQVDLSLIQDFADDSRRTVKSDEMTSRFRTEIKNLGFDYFVALSLCDLQNRPDDAIYVDGYPAGWEPIYVANDFQSIDPFFTAALNERLPFIWHDHVDALEANQGDVARPQREMLEEARHYGIGNGISVPILIPGTFKGCVSVTGLEPEISKHSKHTIHLLGIYFFEACRRINRKALRGWRGKERGALTDKELEVLKWTGAGFTADEISEIQKVSINTVRFHLKNAKRKLEANTIAHAVVNAVLSGQLEL